MEGWIVGMVANGVIFVTFGAVAVLLAVNAVRTGQWRNNPLGLGTVVLYTACAGGHGVHFLQLLGPAIGFGLTAGLAARTEFGEWHIWAIDIAAAVAGTWYWTMRRRFPALVTGTAVFEDLRVRQSRAIEIHDNVVQGLAKAKLALELHLEEEGSAAVDETLAASKRVIADLLGSPELQTWRREPDGEAPA